MTDSRARVLLIGTSNAVFADGYARSLADAEAFRSFESRSIGLASSALFSLTKDGIDFANYDLCILDFCCNDASLTESHYTSDDLIRAQVEDAISLISNAGCTPVILIYPIAKVLPSGGPVRTIYRELAERHRLPFLDGYELIEHIRFTDFSAERIFADDMHLRRDVAREIGHLLVKGLERFWLTARPSGGASRDIDGYSHRMLAAKALAVCPDDTLVLRQTRLTSASCVDCVESDRVLEIAPDEEVVAVAANVGYSNCLLQVTGTSGGALRLSTEHFRSDGSRFVLGVWPLCPPVKARLSRIEIAVRPDAMDGILCGHGALAEGPPRASLVGLVLRRPARLAIRPCSSKAMNLLDGSGDDAARVILQIHNEALESLIVDGLYKGLLKRHADSTGLATYVETLKARGVARGISEVCAAIVGSEEFRRLYDDCRGRPDP